MCCLVLKGSAPSPLSSGPFLSKWYATCTISRNLASRAHCTATASTVKSSECCILSVPQVCSWVVRRDPTRCWISGMRRQFRFFKCTSQSRADVHLGAPVVCAHMMWGLGAWQTEPAGHQPQGSCAQLISDFDSSHAPPCSTITGLSRVLPRVRLCVIGPAATWLNRSQSSRGLLVDLSANQVNRRALPHAPHCCWTNVNRSQHLPFCILASSR